MSNMSTNNNNHRTSPEPICEFTNPCTTYNPTTRNANAPTHHRKVISHIFGRNKASTKLFPSSVWVHYCRKHYQRARYRSAQWPFTQCELLRDSLARMERWGGVRGFEVVLRRREVERVWDARELGGEEAGHRRSGRASSTVRFSSATAGHVGDDDDNETEDDDSNNNDNSNSTSASVGPLTSTTTTTKSNSGSQRKKPLIAPSPVPTWLRNEVGPDKSFEDIRGIIDRLEEHLLGLRGQGRAAEIRFPDIEILPDFREWVFERAGSMAGAGSCSCTSGSSSSGGSSSGVGKRPAAKKRAKGGRVSGRGGVKKV